MVQPVSIDTINKDLISDRQWRERRHPQWTLNYELYRDTVITNRLTQGQSVNVPYMKKTLRTYLTQTNSPVDNTYENKANDKQSELYLNEYWAACAERLRLDILEEVGRKQEWLYGRSFMKLNILDGWFHNGATVKWKPPLPASAPYCILGGLAARRPTPIPLTASK